MAPNPTTSCLKSDARLLEYPSSRFAAFLLLTVARSLRDSPRSAQKVGTRQIFVRLTQMGEDQPPFLLLT
jgi:hypothetical protein